MNYRANEYVLPQSSSLRLWQLIPFPQLGHVRYHHRDRFPRTWLFPKSINMHCSLQFVTGYGSSLSLLIFNLISYAYICTVHPPCLSLSCSLPTFSLPSLATMSGKKGPRPADPSIINIVEDTSDNDRTLYPAKCHCGAVKFSVTLKYPFPKYPVNKCTCSMCTHTGYLLVYPSRRDVVFTEGKILHSLLN
jgi:hypothetical protein